MALTSAQGAASAAERELQIAREIQAGFLPRTLYQPEGWEIAATFVPAREVAGDFYDVFPMANNRRVGMVIADVCDKGVGAALFMALFRTLIRAFAQQNHALSWADSLSGPPRARGGGATNIPSIGTTALRAAITLTNTYIRENHAESGMFASVFFGVLDPATGGLSFVNAGQTPPLIVRGGKVAETLMPSGPAVGILSGIEWEIGQAQLEPEDVLVAYTDGVTEARDEGGGFYGEERLEEFVCREERTALDHAQLLQRDVARFAGSADQSDDITLLTLKRLSSAEAPLPALPRAGRV
jgi:phosphoserine phosphatase RsbU/P